MYRSTPSGNKILETGKTNLEKKLFFLRKEKGLEALEIKDIQPIKKQNMIGNLAEFEVYNFLLLAQRNKKLLQDCKLDNIIGKEIVKLHTTNQQEKVRIQNHSDHEEFSDARIKTTNDSDKEKSLEIKRYLSVPPSRIKKIISKYKYINYFNDQTPIDNHIILFNSKIDNEEKVKKTFNTIIFKLSQEVISINHTYKASKSCN